MHTESTLHYICATSDKVRRHEYIARGPRERYARTVTAVQEHGWHDQLEINKQVQPLNIPYGVRLNEIALDRINLFSST